MPDPTECAAPRVDDANQCIWRGDRRVDLTPKAFLVLHCLMQRPNQIVSKIDLLEAAWPDTHVMEGVLKVAINQLRDALGDDTQQPRFIETVHRRGYRWIGTPEPPATESAAPRISGSADSGSLDLATPLLVGREPAMAQLEQALVRASRGDRQMIFVTGDPGIGKSTLLDAFAARLGAGTPPQPGTAQRFLIGQGQCVDGYGTSDAYMPLLQALVQLCRHARGGDPVGLLRRLAPTWLVQLPQLMDTAEQEDLRRSLAGSSADRMVHDLLCFIEEATALRTIALLLEDLQWSDHATVGALAAMATRRGPARLLIVGTYRVVEAIAQVHPIIRLKHELTSKRQCQEITLEGLDVPAVDAYLERHFPNHRLPSGLPALLKEQTSGNPLFMQNALEEFVQRRWLAERETGWECTVNLDTLADAVPDGTRAMIGFRLQQLSPSDLELLEGASVIGPDFPTQALAAVLEREAAAVEIDCSNLTRAGQFLIEGETVIWPDGKVGMQHAFRHALYRQVLYTRVTPARRQLLHRRFAECLEKGFAADAWTLASQLAHHFERGGDFHRAVEHRRKAARRALDRFAYPQAVEHLRAALAAVKGLPENAERNALELSLQAALLTPLYAVVGATSPALTEVIERIDALSESAEPMTLDLFRALATLVAAHASHGELREARMVSERLVARAEGEIGATLAGGILGFCELMQGEIAAGTPKLERSSTLPEMPGPLDPAIAALADGSLGRGLLGHPSQARDQLALATRRAAEAKRPATIVHVAFNGIRNGVTLLDDKLVEENAAILDSTPIEFGERWPAWSEVAKGWLEIRRGNLEAAARIERARQKLFALGMRGYQPLFAAMVATGLLGAGRYDEAGILIKEGLTLIRTTDECWYEADLLRLFGDLTLARASQLKRKTRRWQDLRDEGEACLRGAIQIARAQSAKWWELRAAVSLARLLGDGDRRGEARKLLSDVYGGFEEGFDLPDLRAAQELLNALGD